jgi:hypothetical protein
MTTVNCAAYSDVYWDQGTSTNYGHETTLMAGGIYNNYTRYKTTIAFDLLTNIPDHQSKVIESAKAYFYCTNTTSNVLRWRRNTFEPDEDGHNNPSTTGTLNNSIALSGAGKWYELDVTDLVIESLNMGTPRNLYLWIQVAAEGQGAPTDTGVVTLNSRESSNEPYLVVTYEDLPPNPPTNLSPTSETKLNNEVIRFSWTHNGTQTGDTQSKFDLLWSSNGGETWNTVSQTTSNQYYDMPANTLPVGSIIWKVRTYATSGIVSEYSEQAAFTSAGKPATPVLTKPDAIENTSTPLIAWTGTGQVMYQAQVLQGSTVVWDSGETASTVGQAQVGTALADGTNYTAKVRIKNQYDLWSDWATKAFTVDFELPNKPTIDIIKDLIRYSARITISNPTPDSAGGFEYNEVYRREVDGEWMRIATNIERNSTYEDCAMKSGQPYEYKVRAVGTYGYMDSDVKFSDVKVKDSQLASLTDKSLYVPLRYDPQRTISISMERVLMRFAGRQQAVTEFGEHIDRGISLRFVIESLENVEKLIQLVESAETLLYRDGKGRKIYCTIGNLSIEELENYWTVSFAIAETSHQEAV